MAIDRSMSRTVFEACLHGFCLFFSAAILAPFANVIALSLSNTQMVMKGSRSVFFRPLGFPVTAYTRILLNTHFIRSFVNTVFFTLINATLVILIPLMAGDALTRKILPFKGVFLAFFAITLYFAGGLVPGYLLVIGLGMTNSYPALILANTVRTFYIIIFRNFINGLQKDIFESAEVDGAGETVDPPDDSRLRGFQRGLILE